MPCRSSLRSQPTSAQCLVRSRAGYIALCIKHHIKWTLHVNNWTNKVLLPKNNTSHKWLRPSSWRYITAFQVFDQQPLIDKQLKTQWAFDFLLVGNLNLSVVSGLWCGPLHGLRSGVSHQEHGLAWQVSFAWSGLFKLMLRQTSFPILVFINQARIAWMFKKMFNRQIIRWLTEARKYI